jgi:hypothetical protein
LSNLVQKRAFLHQIQTKILFFEQFSSKTNKFVQKTRFYFVDTLLFSKKWKLFLCGNEIFFFFAQKNQKIRFHPPNPLNPFSHRIATFQSRNG